MGRAGGRPPALCDAQWVWALGNMTQVAQRRGGAPSLETQGQAGVSLSTSRCPSSVQGVGPHGLQSPFQLKPFHGSVIL